MACGNIGCYDKAHTLIEFDDLNNRSIEFITTVIHFYGKIGCINSARNVFNNISENQKDIVSVGAIMKCLIDNNFDEDAILLYEQYMYSGIIAHNDVSCLLYIVACGNIGYYDKGKQLLDSMRDINARSIQFINTSIDFYAKNGDINNAANIFNNLSKQNQRNLISISTMMNAYNNNEKYSKTLDLFNQIKQNGIIMDKHIYCNALIAAGNIVSFDQGLMIIDDLNKSENIHLLNCLYVQSSIIIMYGKCNQFEEAVNIFNNIDIDNKDSHGILYLYNAIMDCYAKRGNTSQLLLLFNNLKNDKQLGIQITDVIYSTVLNGCSHSGLINEAQSIFEEIKVKYNNNNKKNIPSNIVTPLIDCLGRKGSNYLDKAEKLYEIYIEKNVFMNYKFKLPALFSLLSSCRLHNDIIRSKRIVDKINIIKNKHQIDNDITDSMQALLSNIYAQNKIKYKIGK